MAKFSGGGHFFLHFLTFPFYSAILSREKKERKVFKMWLIFTLLCTLLWGLADLFYKIGARHGEEKYSHLLTGITVGLVMGAHAIFVLLTSDVGYDPVNILIYLPVSLFYIISMVVGYLGLKYLELSISSPVENSSGAVVCILCLIFLGESLDLLSAASVVVITVGIVLLGWSERVKPNEILPEDKKYRKSAFALVFPLIYCVLDALGTFFDAFYLDDIEKTPLVGVTEENFENVANISYELTFLIAAAVMLFYILVIKREKIEVPKQGTKLVAAVFETAGQFFYVYAMSGNAVVAAPVISAYCVVSALLAAVVLKEKLKPLQYAAITAVIVGIVLLGVVEGLAEA